MEKDYLKKCVKTKRVKYVVLGYALLGGLFACFIDFDHIPLWLFKVKLGWWLPNIFWSVSMEGRNLHSLYFWLPVCFVLAGVLASFMARLIQPDVVYQVNEDFHPMPTILTEVDT